jgi:hypothetical protein
MGNNLIENIKKSSGIKSAFDMIGCSKNKILFMWTPRAGCSSTCQCAYDLLNLLKDGLEYNPFIHHYRTELFLSNVNYIRLSILIKNKYTMIKTIINPYQRAVSIWSLLCNVSNPFYEKFDELSFREFIKKLCFYNFANLTQHMAYHAKPQYIKNEEKFVTKYLKIDKDETYDFVKADGSIFKIDISKYSSPHHTKRKIINEFCGDIKLRDLPIFPQSYKLFYDDEIKNNVYNYYKKDFEKYNYTFDDLK